ncbi:Glycerol kinase, partial [human gut metagenome]
LGSEDLEVLHADGGATASRLLMQCQADLLGRSVVVSSNAEVSALGAALMGFTRLGWPLPDLESDGGRRYEPLMEPAARAAARSQWGKALS